LKVDDFDAEFVSKSLIW